MNTGGWFLLTVLFGTLLLFVQRSEPRWRWVAFIILAIVGVIVWRYAIYRMSGDCAQVLKAFCEADLLFQQRAEQIAINTTNVAILTAVTFNLLFWIIFGRSNPPRSSSDVIKVLGMED